MPASRTRIGPGGRAWSPSRASRCWSGIAGRCDGDICPPRLVRGHPGGDAVGRQRGRPWHRTPASRGAVAGGDPRCRDAEPDRGPGSRGTGYAGTRPNRHRRSDQDHRRPVRGLLLQRPRRPGRVVHPVHDLGGAPRSLRAVPDAPEHRHLRADLPRAGGCPPGGRDSKTPATGTTPPTSGCPRDTCRCGATWPCRWYHGPGEVLGGLFFGHPEAGVFSEWDERLIVGIAAQAAVAIDNARLYQEARNAGAVAAEERRVGGGVPTQGRVPCHARARTPQPARPASATPWTCSGRDPNVTSRQATDMMGRQVANLVRLVDDLIDLCRIMRGKVDAADGAVRPAVAVRRPWRRPGPSSTPRATASTLACPPSRCPWRPTGRGWSR